MNSRIYLSSPHMGGNEKKYIEDAFDTNWISPSGPNIDGFEESLQAYLGNDNYVASLSSGTAALHLALILLGVGRDDEVLCQSMTFIASASPIVHQGAIPVFIDSEKDTWNLCPNYLEEAIKDRISKGKKPKAIIAVHLFGMPFKVNEIKDVSKKYNIPLIEDCAAALGSSYENKKCGTFGDIAILSFNGNKIITTSGGGALVSKTLEFKEKAIFLATQAKDDMPYYQHSQIGYNYRLSNICAGIGRGQMEVLDDHIALRKEMNQFYKEVFNKTEHVSVFTEPSTKFKSNYWLSCITVDSLKAGFSSKDIRNELLIENIEARPLWKPLHLQPIFKGASYFGSRVAENLFSIGLCLPSGSNLTSLDKERINDVLIKFSL